MPTGIPFSPKQSSLFSSSRRRKSTNQGALHHSVQASAEPSSSSPVLSSSSNYHPPSSPLVSRFSTSSRSSCSDQSYRAPGASQPSSRRPSAAQTLFANLLHHHHHSSQQVDTEHSAQNDDHKNGIHPSQSWSASLGSSTSKRASRRPSLFKSWLGRRGSAQPTSTSSSSPTSASAHPQKPPRSPSKFVPQSQHTFQSQANTPARRGSAATVSFGTQASYNHHDQEHDQHQQYTAPRLLPAVRAGSLSISRPFTNHASNSTNRHTANFTNDTTSGGIANAWIYNTSYQWTQDGRKASLAPTGTPSNNYNNNNVSNDFSTNRVSSTFPSSYDPANELNHAQQDNSDNRSVLSMTLTEEIALYLPENQPTSPQNPPPDNQGQSGIAWNIPDWTPTRQRPHYLDDGEHAAYQTEGAPQPSNDLHRRQSDESGYLDPFVSRNVAQPRMSSNASSAGGDANGIWNHRFSLNPEASLPSQQDQAPSLGFSVSSSLMQARPRSGTVQWREQPWQHRGTMNRWKDGQGPNVDVEADADDEGELDELDEYSPTAPNFPPPAPASTYREAERASHERATGDTSDAARTMDSGYADKTPKLVGGNLEPYSPTFHSHSQQRSEGSLQSSPLSPDFPPPQTPRTPLASAFIHQQQQRSPFSNSIPHKDGTAAHQHFEMTKTRNAIPAFGPTEHALNPSMLLQEDNLEKQFCSVLLLDLGNGTAIPMSPSPSTERKDPMRSLTLSTP